MAPLPPRPARICFRRQLLPATLLLFAPFAVPLHAADDTASVSGTVQLPPPAHSAGMAHLMAESVYQHGATATMDMPPDPPAAVVYAEPADDPARAALAAWLAAHPKPPDATVAQKDLRFIPTLLPIRVGTSFSRTPLLVNSRK